MTRATWLPLAVPLHVALAVTAAASTALIAAPRTARAAGGEHAKGTPLYVLTLSTDDSDDQAEALTQALRSRIRTSAGWSLLETTQSFETLSIALKCPPRPDAACLQRVGDQLHTDRFIWGTVARKGAGQVGADVHLWSRGKPDVVASEAYSENLKDANEESLRAIATKLFGRLGGGTGGAGGTLVVHAGSAGGEVQVDGQPAGRLEGGVARVDVPAGAHTVAVRVPGFDPVSQPSRVNAGAEEELTFQLSPSLGGPADTGGGAPFPARKVVAYSAIVVGGALLIASGVEMAQWLSDYNTNKSDRQQVDPRYKDVCATEVNAFAQDACQKSKDAVTVSTLGWIFGGLGAAAAASGVVLLLTDHPSTEGSATPAARREPAGPRVMVLPAVGPRGGSLGLHVTF